ncbi:hypothetical protein [Mycobacterium decipiens]|uniref:PE domain-containing protein n=1 Tax=Mycobacterium decipiens TaxID=1430326 RepID=A0A1X2LP84_9MYCO|nr:hypothetical protein [Mycobacterium decipiens]OSC37021.1 hypothetical protein B8W66_22105 [Mycobacterium decipiens]
MGSSELKVASEQLRQTAIQWQGLSSGFTSTASPPGQPFQPTTTAIGAIDAVIGVGAAACMARTRATAAGVATAATGYTNQDASGANRLAAAAPPTVLA